jgi:hypothetical protein
MTLARPMFPPPAEPAGAPGAVQLSSVSLIPASPADASQLTLKRIEPEPVIEDSTSGTGSTTLSRRLLMNMLVTAAGVCTGGIALDLATIFRPCRPAPHRQALWTRHSA